MSVTLKEIFAPELSGEHRGEIAAHASGGCYERTFEGLQSFGRKRRATDRGPQQRFRHESMSGDCAEWQGAKLPAFRKQPEGPGERRHSREAIGLLAFEHGNAPQGVAERAFVREGHVAGRQLAEL